MLRGLRYSSLENVSVACTLDWHGIEERVYVEFNEASMRDGDDLIGNRQDEILNISPLCPIISKPQTHSINQVSLMYHPTFFKQSFYSRWRPPVPPKGATRDMILKRSRSPLLPSLLSTFNSPPAAPLSSNERIGALHAF
jgi:hypothetical protein